MWPYKTAQCLAEVVRAMLASNLPKAHFADMQHTTWPPSPEQRRITSHHQWNVLGLFMGNLAPAPLVRYHAGRTTLQNCPMLGGSCASHACIKFAKGALCPHATYNMATKSWTATDHKSSPMNRTGAICGQSRSCTTSALTCWPQCISRIVEAMEAERGKDPSRTRFESGFVVERRPECI